ncbi:MAG: inositol monophosphatase family protein [Acidimicrobiales bacterium]|jgi:histidinol phosphatase-like enzyme (inositol monophosphatase family)
MDEFAKLTELTTDPLAELLKEAVELARRAGELTLGYFRSNALTIELKSDGSPVTQADRQAERLIRDELAFHHPGDGILGEEEDEKPSETGRRWIVDPIDGTLAFTHGVGLFSNLLALEDEYGSAVGVINVPALGETIYAARGLGCYCNGVPAKVSERGELAGSYLTTSSFGEWDETALLGVRRAGIELRTWGDGYGYALVATGRMDAMADSWAKPYDIAPMPVIISEAGGCFTDWQGAPGFDGGSGLATNGRIHSALLRLLGPQPGDE